MKFRYLLASVCFFTQSLISLNMDVPFEKLEYIDNQTLSLVYRGLRESMIDCKRLAEVVAQNNHIVIVDLGCAVGDFLNSFHQINYLFPPILNYTAIGVDPLVKQYKERFGWDNSNGLYRKVYDAVISDKNGLVDINVNQIFLDLSSIKNIDKVVFHNLPSKYDVMKPAVNDAYISKMRCPSLTLNTLCLHEKLDHIDVLKIDTQGNEFEILNSIGHALLNKIAIIYVETSVPDKNVLYKNQENFQSISKLLFKNNFSLVGAYGLDDYITLEESIDINCIFINRNIFKY